MKIDFWRYARSLLNSFDEEVHEASDESDEELPPKRIALHQTSVPRYHKVFNPPGEFSTEGDYLSVCVCFE